LPGHGLAVCLVLNHFADAALQAIHFTPAPLVYPRTDDLVTTAEEAEEEEVRYCFFLLFFLFFFVIVIVIVLLSSCSFLLS
jgi:heme/copper-type cytochrome/quinol oxidase subunit 2